MSSSNSNIDANAESNNGHSENNNINSEGISTGHSAPDEEEASSGSRLGGNPTIASCPRPGIELIDDGIGPDALVARTDLAIADEKPVAMQRYGAPGVEQILNDNEGFEDLHNLLVDEEGSMFKRKEASGSIEQVAPSHPPTPFDAKEFEDTKKNPLAPAAPSTGWGDADTVREPPEEQDLQPTRVEWRGLPGTTVNEYNQGRGEASLEDNGDVGHATNNNEDHVDEEESAQGDTDVEQGSTLHIPVAWVVERNEENGGDGDTEDVVVAIPALPWWKQPRTKILLGAVLAIVMALAIALGIALASNNGNGETTSTVNLVVVEGSEAPSISISPSLFPTTSLIPSSSLLPSLIPSLVPTKSHVPTETCQWIFINVSYSEYPYQSFVRGPGIAWSPYLTFWNISETLIEYGERQVKLHSDSSPITLKVGGVVYSAEYFRSSGSGSSRGTLCGCGDGANQCDCKDKVCLIERGNGIYFYDKALSCKNGGGKAAIIYNNEAFDINEYREKWTLSSIDILVIAVSQADGQHFLEGSMGEIAELTLSDNERRISQEHCMPIGEYEFSIHDWNSRNYYWGGGRYSVTTANGVLIAGSQGWSLGGAVKFPIPFVPAPSMIPSPMPSQAPSSSENPSQGPSVSIVPTSSFSPTETCHWINVYEEYAGNARWYLYQFMDNGEKAMQKYSEATGGKDYSSTQSLCLQEGRYEFTIEGYYNPEENNEAYSVTLDDGTTILEGDYGVYDVDRVAFSIPYRPDPTAAPYALPSQAPSTSMPPTSSIPPSSSSFVECVLSQVSGNTFTFKDPASSSTDLSPDPASSSTDLPPEQLKSIPDLQLESFLAQLGVITYTIKFETDGTGRMFGEDGDSELQLAHFEGRFATFELSVNDSCLSIEFVEDCNANENLNLIDVVELDAFNPCDLGMKIIGICCDGVND